MPCCEVEEEERVEGERDGEIVDDGDVEVGLARVPIAILVETVRLQPDGDEDMTGFTMQNLKKQR